MPPASPSKEDLLHYESLFRKIDTPNETTLILGTTPALRKLAAKYFQKIVVADFSPQMIEATKSLLDEETLKKERYCTTNWLNLGRRFNGGTFALVVGDSTFKQLDPSLAPQLTENISSILKTGGIFTTRIRLHKEYWGNCSVDDIVKQFFVEKRNGRPDANAAFIFRMYDKLADKDGRVLVSPSPNALYPAIGFLHPGKQQLVRGIWKAYNPGPICWSHMREEMFESFVGKKFSILTKKTANDYLDSDAFPVFGLINNK